jgi:ABC-type glycerol-3-phosphate transport system substrate-binding protein
VQLFSRDGHAYALPVVNVVASMGINLSMLKEIGYTMPAQKDWTTEEFLVLAEKLKAKGYPATIIMTKDGMIDWNMGWMYAFGAKLYANGDHSKVAINSPEAVQALNYMKMLVDKGYAYPNPNEQNDDAGVELFTTYQVFSCMLQNGHVDYWAPEQVKQGKLKEVFEYDFVEFPHVKGQAHTPVQGYQTIVVGHNAKNEAKNKAIAKLMVAMSDDHFQKYIVAAGGGFPTWVGMEMGAEVRQSSKNLAALARTAGLMDVGVYLPKRPEVRRAWLVPIQEFFNGKISAEEVLDRFEAEANKILVQ